MHKSNPTLSATKHNVFFFFLISFGGSLISLHDDIILHSLHDDIILQADVKDAVQTSLMYSLMYDPKLSMLAPSYAYAPDTEQSPVPEDGDLWAGQFEWDQSFAAYVSIHNLEP
jgi:hypothetical protein